MPPISTIRRLPEELRKAIEEALACGHTLDEITAMVRGMGGEVSRSAVGRYKQNLDKLLERSRRARVASEAIVHSLCKRGSAEILQGNVELMHGILMQTIGESDAPDAREVKLLADAADKLARAAKTSLEIERMETDAARAVVDAEIESSRAIEVRFVKPTVELTEAKNGNSTK